MLISKEFLHQLKAVSRELKAKAKAVLAANLRERRESEMLRFHILTTACLDSSFSRTLLLAFGLVSMCLATPFILAQTNLKRLLAYSSLEHVGLICAGIGLNSSLTIFGALLHMGYHALTKPVLFFAAGNIHQTCHTVQMRLIGPGMLKVLPLESV